MPRGSQRKGGRRGRPTMLASTPTAELRRELERRQSMLHDIIRQRDALNAELEELQGAAGGMPAAPARRGPGRPPGPGRRRGRPPGVKARRGPGRPPGAATGAPRRGRPPGKGNKTNLATALRGVLSGKTMSVAEVSDAVQKAGYKTSSPNFRTIVNQALISNPSAFKKVARGQYTAR